MRTTRALSPPMVSLSHKANDQSTYIHSPFPIHPSVYLTH